MPLPPESAAVAAESIAEIANPGSREALAALQANVAPGVASGFAANPALLAEPNVAANVVANIGLNVLPILGGIFAVAAIIGGTRYAYRKIVQESVFA